MITKGRSLPMRDPEKKIQHHQANNHFHAYKSGKFQSEIIADMMTSHLETNRLLTYDQKGGGAWPSNRKHQLAIDNNVTTDSKKLR